MLASAHSNLSLSCLSLIFGPGLWETWWFVEVSLGRTKDILQYDNGIMPASVKMCHINYTLWVTTCIMGWCDSPQSAAKHTDMSLIIHFHDPQAAVSLKVPHQNSSGVFNYKSKMYRSFCCAMTMQKHGAYSENFNDNMLYLFSLLSPTTHTPTTHPTLLLLCGGLFDDKDVWSSGGCWKHKHESRLKWYILNISLLFINHSLDRSINCFRLLLD